MAKLPRPRAKGDELSEAISVNWMFHKPVLSVACFHSKIVIFGHVAAYFFHRNFGQIKMVVATGETSTPKRSRKKKTLAELREEESFLLKEERSLKNQLATLRLTLEKQRTRNESLKRMKLDILSHQATEIVRASHASEEAIFHQCDQVKLAHEPSEMLLPANGACNELNPSHPNGSFAPLEDESKVSSFVLPDLNLPFDDDSSSGVLYGIS
ncbi:hypothetical protein Pint_30262 [Pistacia integerrima]|uniref:Uncharacterized protein n=1 Tax=Pistacia integerrima TaxID=434235 RepID=A0ACC0X2G3_9ROSI|nr:hypothetical protein Pint_30262 [Pistacia integerrima]